MDTAMRRRLILGEVRIPAGGNWPVDGLALQDITTLH